ncbi:hypothetical protein HK102_007499 [Quaeritorhiza haematococci]|nr:hypothetical protein HK102_007499 [Quaeritorhiza haematococci]
MRLKMGREGSSDSLNTIVQSDSTDNLLSLSNSKSMDNLSRASSVDNLSRLASTDNLLGLAEGREPEPVKITRDRSEGTISDKQRSVWRRSIRFLKNIFSMGMRFWLLCATTIAVYGSVVPFFHISTDFFQQKWYPGDTQMSGLAMSIPDMISAFGSPICGLILDRFGHRELYLPTSAALIFIAHLLMWATTLTPFFAMSVLGVAYSMFASALWSSVPFLVGSTQIGTAYGFVTIALNISLSIFPLVIAGILNIGGEGEGEVATTATSEETGRAEMLTRFGYAQWFFMALSLVGVAMGIVLTVACNRYKKREEAAGAGEEEVSVSQTQTIHEPLSEEALN